MRREERRRRFNEAVVNCLYPPSPSESDGEEDQSPEISPEELNVDSFPLPGCSEGSSESEGNEDGEKGKLTRAQRKRIRRKRLREESVRRGLVIGPLLPLDKDDESGGVPENETPIARQIAPVGGEHRGDASPSTKQRRLKHRRMAKKQAKVTLRPSSDTTKNN